VARTTVYDDLQKDADALVQRIVSRNLGRPAAPRQGV